MGLDYGTARIGVALTDTLKITAQPAEVLVAGDPELMDRIQDLVADRDVEAIVVGLPLALSGNETASTRGARQLAADVARAVTIPVHLSDERFTTKTAEEALVSGNVRRKQRKAVVDKVAAAVMLQHYLEGL